ncbi:MAG: 2'-5' RNA ligase family protein, partial [Acidimicrobiales bacterium]
DLGPDVVAELRSLIGAQLPFPFSCRSVGTFPGVVWLAPEPDEGFRRLSEVIGERWPELAPYGGAYPTEIFHLTVGRGRLRRSWRTAIEAAVPIESQVTAVLLMTEDGDGSWMLRERFGLG